MLRTESGECVVLCGVVWCGVVWCGVVWCGVVWCGVVWCAVWCGVVWCGVVWCGVVWCGMVWCGVVWCGGSAVHGAQSAFLHGTCMFKCVHADSVCDVDTVESYQVAHHEEQSLTTSNVCKRCMLYDQRVAWQPHGTRTASACVPTWQLPCMVQYYFWPMIRLNCVTDCADNNTPGETLIRP
jgi:hypothetical protein